MRFTIVLNTVFEIIFQPPEGVENVGIIDWI